MSTPSPTQPTIATIACIAAGLIIAALGGIKSGSIIGGIVAGLGVVPGCWGAWVGMQQETQGGLATAVLLIFASLIVGGLLIALRLFSWLS